MIIQLFLKFAARKTTGAAPVPDILGETLQYRVYSQVNLLVFFPLLN